MMGRDEQGQAKDGRSRENRPGDGQHYGNGAEHCRDYERHWIERRGHRSKTCALGQSNNYKDCSRSRVTERNSDRGMQTC